MKSPTTTSNFSSPRTSSSSSSHLQSHNHHHLSSPHLSPSSESRVISKTDEFGRIREKTSVPIRKHSNPNAIDRSKISPVYIQCFIKNGGHPRTRDQLLSTKFHDAHIHIYSWSDATLKEIAYLIAEKYTELDMEQYRLSFKLFPVTGDPTNPHLAIDMGSVHLLESNKDDQITLKDVLFKLGSDLLSVSLIPFRERDRHGSPKRHRSISPPRRRRSPVSRYSRR